MRFDPGEHVVIGSEDATTCVIAVLLDIATATAWVAHYVGSSKATASRPAMLVQQP